MKLGRKILYNFIIQKIVSALLYLYMWLVYLTSKINQNNSLYTLDLIANKEKIIFVYWHGRLSLMPLFVTRNKYQFTSVTSAHKDGDMVAGVIKMFGSKVIRGSSSSRATTVIRQSLKALQKPGVALSIVPDGPRGPRMRINSEFTAIAQKTGACIIPVTFSCKKAKFLRSWDRFMVPHLFNNITFEYGSTYRISKEATKEDLNKTKLKIENEMNNITWGLDAKYSHPKIEQG